MRQHGVPFHKENEWVALYRLFDDDGVLLYVGISNWPEVRFMEHEAIYAENPIYNIMRPWPLKALLPPGPRDDPRAGFGGLADSVDAWLDSFTAPEVEA